MNLPRVLRILQQLIFMVIYRLISPIPYSFALKRYVLRAAGATIGSAVKMKSGCIFEPPGHLSNLHIGEGTFVNTGCRFASRGAVFIGSRCAIGPGVFFETVSHYHAPDGALKTIAKDIVVGDNVWVGAGCIILPGIRVGSFSVVGAGAVVTKDVAPHSVVAGVPAKSISKV